MSLLYSSECKPMSTLRVQRSELASVLHVSEGKVRDEGWEVRLGNKGVKSPLSGTLDSLPRFGISLSKGRKHVSVQIMRMHWKRERKGEGSEKGRERLSLCLLLGFTLTCII